MPTVYSRIFFDECPALKKKSSFLDDERISISNIFVNQDSILKKLKKEQKRKLRFLTMIKTAKLELSYVRLWESCSLFILTINKSETLFSTISMMKILQLYKNLFKY